MSTETPASAEHRRLAEATGRLEDELHTANPWYRWGPYLSERAWGTVREDYSADGSAWDFFPHDHARSRAYRWNEDGMAGISDIEHQLCLALALWNGRDPILKERMFGLTGPQGNHGEDAKEYWWYLEGLPSHALLRWRYHYPQDPYPYEWLIEENARRSREDPEFELMDTGVFADGRYWGVEVTYAKASPEDVLCRIRIENHGPSDETLHVLPTLWFRNTWSWSGTDDAPGLSLEDGAIVVEHPVLGGHRLEAAPLGGATPEALFCDNETNAARLFGAADSPPYPKDGINDHVITGAPTVNPAMRGTKAAWWYRVAVPAGGTAEVRLRLRGPQEPAEPEWAGVLFDRTVAAREADADEFYATIAPADTDPERIRILRQAAAGLVWSKQMYPYDVDRWLKGDPAQPKPPGSRYQGRNAGWRHLDAFDVLAMPDPWEYPWFASWDLAFHAVAWAHIDPAFAKYQLIALLREWFMHPNGAIPAYEWSFDDINPPVHPLAALRIFEIDGGRDHDFLERVLQKLVINHTWWLNREDPEGNNIFSGGFLGLDNISPIDRSHLPPGVTMQQADGTGWMAFASLGLLGVALRLAGERPVYRDMVIKFLEHFVMTVQAMADSHLYDAEDGFFYDVIRDAGGNEAPIRVRSVAGLLPLLSIVALPPATAAQATRLGKRFARIHEVWDEDEHTPGSLQDGSGGPEVISVLGPEKLLATLAVFFDEERFLSPHGLRSVSREHRDNPYTVEGMPYATIKYEPAESSTAMYGGNSNWRGPVWFPLNYLMVRALILYERALGEDFTAEYPTGSGTRLRMREIAQDLADRLVAIWLPGEDGVRPAHRRMGLLETDPAWRDNLLFFEYFNGDDGAGVGASHQTGWTALVVDLIASPPGQYAHLDIQGLFGRAAGR